MTLISKSVTAFGLILLAHACYSAHEHSALLQTTSVLPSLAASDPHPSTAPGSSGATAAASSALPIDIAVETIVATLVICLGLVANTASLKPIQWRVWAGQMEREEAEMANVAAGSSNESKVSGYTGNPFRLLESRPGFVDIRKQRREFAEWAKGQA